MGKSLVSCFLTHGVDSVELRKAAAVVSETVGGCRGLAGSLLPIGNIVTSSAIAKVSIALASSCSRGSARSLGDLRITPTWRAVSYTHLTLPTKRIV